MRRRTFLAVTGAGALAGCGAFGGETFEKSGGAFSNVETKTDLPEGVEYRSGQINLNDGEFTSIDFQGPVENHVTVEGQVVQNGPIDVYIMTTGQFTEFEREPQLVSAQRKYESVKTIDIDETVDEGGHHIVFDNTYIGGAEPSGKATIQFTFEVSGPTGTDSEGNSTDGGDSTPG
jgi:hypothetical protein